MKRLFNFIRSGEFSNNLREYWRESWQLELFRVLAGSLNTAISIFVEGPFNRCPIVSYFIALVQNETLSLNVFGFDLLNFIVAAQVVASSSYQ